MYKVLTTLIALLLFTAPLFAEQKTLFNTPSDLGGFGGPTVKVTSIMNKMSFLIGGRGAGVIDSAFTIGGGGYGLTSDISLGRPALYPPVQDSLNYYFPYYTSDLSIQMGYGGLELGYIFHSDEAIHATIYCLVGGGGVDIGYSTGSDVYVSRNHWNDVEHDGFIVIEPTASIELNMSIFFRIEIGASYRYVGGLVNEFVTEDDIDGVSATVTFKFGKFEGLLDDIFD